MEAAEIEDLFPPKFLAGEVDRIEREPEKRFGRRGKRGKSVALGQVEDLGAIGRRNIGETLEGRSGNESKEALH